MSLYSNVGRKSVMLIAAAALAGWAHVSVAASKAGAADAVSSPYPDHWSLYALNAAHDASWGKGQGSAPRWSTPLPGAVPKHATKAWIQRHYVTITAVRDLVGIPVGVSVVKGHIYVADDNDYLYSVNATTGRIEWKFNAGNQIMTTPLVAGHGAHRLVYVGGGNSTFSYSQATRFGKPGATVSRGTDISGIYAVDARTGRSVWSYHTQGEDMPTPAVYQGRIIFGNGDGHVRALDARSGKLLWQTTIHSFVSMSSATRYKDLIIMAGTHPNAVYAVHAATGQLAWRMAPGRVFSSSMGDCAPAQADGVVVTQYESKAGTAGRAISHELGLDARDGHMLWNTSLGEGKVPPRNKDAVPLIADGVVYTGSPVTASAYALNLRTGHILWRTALKVKMKAAPSLYGPYALYPVGNGKIFVLDRATGHKVRVYATRHGGFGPQNAVIANGSLIIGTNFGWLYSRPLAEITQAAR